jgi:hypothetical protein
MQDARCRRQDAGRKMQEAGCRTQDAGHMATAAHSVVGVLAAKRDVDRWRHDAQPDRRLQRFLQATGGHRMGTLQSLILLL